MVGFLKKERVRWFFIGGAPYELSFWEHGLYFNGLGEEIQCILTAHYAPTSSIETAVGRERGLVLHMHHTGLWTHVVSSNVESQKLEKKEKEKKKEHKCGFPNRGSRSSVAGARGRHEADAESTNQIFLRGGLRAVCSYLSEDFT